MKITYEDKVSIQNDEEVAKINKVTDDDMNEIKKVVNTNYDELETAKTSISSIENEQKTQNTNISNLQADNKTNKTDISNIKAEQTEQNTEIEELRAENQRLREDLNGLPSGTAEGEIIDITESAEMRFSELNIRGNSMQKIREGDNVLKQKNISDFSKNGVDIACNSDGTIYVFGTASDVVDITLCGLWASTEVQFSLKAGQYKYTSNNSGVSLYLVNNTSAKKVEDNAILTLTEDYDVTDAFIRIESGKTVDVIIKPMLYLYQGTEREYEQYGVSPSPDYPSEVESCGDNVNLFDKDSAIKGAYYNSSNVLTTSTTWKYFEFTPKSKRDYTIKSTKYASEVYFVGFDSSGNSTIITNFSSNKVTFNANDYVKIGYSVHKDDIDNVKLVEGTKVGENSLYGQGCITEVICNKNLAKILNGIWYNSTTQTFTTDIQGYGYMTKIKENSKITISKKNTGYRFVVLTSKEEIAANGTYSRAVFLESDGKTTKYTFTTQENEKYVFFGYYRGTDEDAKNLASQEIQIEISEVKTGYEVHKEQVYTIPTQQSFRACGDYADTFIKKNNKWYERHSITRLILNGTENWEISSDTNFFFVTNIISSIDYSKLYCNIALSASSYTELTDGTARVAVRNSGNGIYISNENNMTLEGWKAWLVEQYNAGTPVYVDYVLTTPLDIECTEEQSTILWDIEQNAKTYKNITHMYSTDEISPVIEVTYKKDIETLFANTLVESGV